MSTRLWILGSVFFLTVFMPLSQADNRGYVGLQGGVSFPSLSSNVFSWGLTGAYKISPLIGVGPMIMKYGMGLEAESDSGSASIGSSNVFYGAELHVFLPNTLKGFQTGLKLGLVHTNVQISATDGTSTIQITNSMNSIFVAPKLSYDYPVGRYSLGAELSYILGLASHSPRAFNMQIVSKFWF